MHDRVHCRQRGTVLSQRTLRRRQVQHAVNVLWEVILGMLNFPGSQIVQKRLGVKLPLKLVAQLGGGLVRRLR
jgi:hypothetical protein